MYFFPHFSFHLLFLLFSIGTPVAVAHRFTLPLRVTSTSSASHAGHVLHVSPSRDDPSLIVVVVVVVVIISASHSPTTRSKRSKNRVFTGKGRLEATRRTVAKIAFPRSLEVAMATSSTTEPYLTPSTENSR